MDSFDRFLPKIVSEVNQHAIVDSTDHSVVNPALAYLLSLGTEQSRAKMKRLLNKTAKLFGYENFMHCPWQNIRHTDVLALKSKFEMQELAPATINLYISAIKGVAYHAWANSQMNDHQYTVIKSIKGTRGSRVSRGRALSMIESSRLLSRCDRDESIKGIRDAAIFSVGIGCGLRRAEICSLKIKDIDFENQSVTVIGKGNKQRTIYCSDSAWARLKEWLDIRIPLEGVPEVFCAIHRGDHVQANQSLTENAIYITIKRRAASLNIKDFSTHDMRRTYATRLFEIGGDINTVKKAMGHASVLTTQRYDKRNDDALKRLTRKVAL